MSPVGQVILYLSRKCNRVGKLPTKGRFRGVDYRRGGTRRSHARPGY